jgi:hypothetical protein
MKRSHNTKMKIGFVKNDNGLTLISEHVNYEIK